MLDLNGLALDGMDFSGARFPDGIDARGARFDGLAWFKDVHFGTARFDGATFMNDARFEGAVFGADACFAVAEFRGIGRYDGVRFAEGADFTGITCYGNFSLQDVRADGALSLRGAEWLGGLWCDGAALPADADTSDTQVHGRLWLRRATLGNAPMKAEDFELSFGYAYI